MWIQGKKLPIQFRTSGIGEDIVIDNCLWAFYPTNISISGKYIGHIICPKGTLYHVIQIILLDGVKLKLRKARTGKPRRRGNAK